ncbi:MAG: hypothetical protein FWE29_02900 [Defluviitaleaceae bacterium]|nr:hypothetical protein [Defluviitaleaceae bacterium]
MRQIIKLSLFIISLFATAFLAACGFDFNFDFALENTAANVSEAVFDVSAGFVPLEELEISDEPLPLMLYIRYDEYILAMYEPPTNYIYLGAFIEEDNLLAGDIGMFERLSGVSHAIFAYRYTLGDPFPVRFVLQSLARSKMPLIEIHPGDIYDEIDYYQIEDLAMAFGEFNVPIFISFNASEAGLDRSKSKEFFIALRKAFSIHAPKAAFVWGISFESGSRMFDYYPGDEWVDWVGISAFSNITPEGNHSDIFERLDAFYFAFQERKPIMITGLGVSNFSTIDHSYRVAEASFVLQYIYERIADRYPRIKAIIYAGYRREIGGITQSHQLTDSDRLLSAYNAATEGDRFTAEIDITSAGQKVSQWILSQHTVKIIGDTVFIPRQSLESDFGASSAELNRWVEYLEIIDDEQFFNVNLLHNFGMRRVVIDENNAKVFISSD